MDLTLQSKLLRVLQEREVTWIGGSESIRLDTRFIVATNRDLAEEVRKGRFREDLYFRLLGLPIHLPPLRDRGNDVLILAKHLAEEFCRENKMPKIGFSNDARDKLQSYNYPGNVRELKAVAELAVVMSDGEQIAAGNISFHAVNKNQEVLLAETMTLNDYNIRIIKAYMEKYDNNMVTVAEKLKIGKSTLLEKPVILTTLRPVQTDHP